MQKNLLASSGNCEQVLGWEDRLNCVTEHSPGKLLNHKLLETGRVSIASITMCLSSSYTLAQAVAIGCYWNWDPIGKLRHGSDHGFIVVFDMLNSLCGREKWFCYLLWLASHLAGGNLSYCLFPPIQFPPIAVNLSSLSTVPGVYVNPSFFLHEVNQTKGVAGTPLSLPEYTILTAFQAGLPDVFVCDTLTIASFFCISDLSLHYEPVPLLNLL